MAEILWTVGSFAVLGFFVWRVGLPAVRRAGDNRRSRVEGQLAKAATAEQEAAAINSEYSRRLADATGEADRIIGEGREQAARVQREMALDAEQVLGQLRDQATAAIEVTRAQAIADAQAEAAELAATIADHLTRRSGDASAPRQIAPIEPRDPRAS